MAGNQFDNLLLLEAGLSRTLESSDIIQMSAQLEVQNDALITGNLTVQGTTFSNEAEISRYADNHLYLNDGYTTAVAQTGGLVVNYLPIATTDTVAASGFVAGVAATSNPVVTTTGAGTFAVGQFIQISGANEEANNGLFEVLSHVGTALTVRGIGLTATVEDFTQNDFVTDTVVAGSITRVNVSIMRSGTDGIWETGLGATTPVVFSDIGTGTGNDLQAAYVLGNTITTSAPEGDVIITGTEQLLITATGGIDIDTVLDFDGTVFDVQMTGANGFSIDGTAASNVSVDAGLLTLETTTSGDISVSSVDSVSVVGAEAVADAVFINASNAAGGIDIDAGTAGIAVDTTGPLSLDSTGTDANLTLTATSAGAATMVIEATNAGAGGGNIDINVDDIFTLDADEFSIDGTAASNVSVAGAGIDLTLASGAGRVVVNGGEATADAVFINASNAAGGIDIDAGTAGIAADTTGPLSLDSTGTDANLTLTSNDAGTATLVLEVTNAGAGDGDLDINVDNSLTIDAVDFSLDGTAASNVTVTGGDLTLSTTTSGAVLITSAGDSVYTVPDPSASAFSLTDGTSTYINVDSTAGLEGLDLDQHVNLVEGAGVELDTDGSTSLVAGDLVVIDAGGDLQLADADTGSLRDAWVAGVSRGTFGTGTTSQLFTVPGSVVPVRFTSAPAAGANGRVAFLSATPGQASVTPPTFLATTTLFVLGVIQGADGVATTVDVLWQPNFIARGPSVTLT